MRLSIEQIEKDLASSKWTINVICPQAGAIIVINNAFTTNVATLRKVNGKYITDKEMTYSTDFRTPLAAMINAHNSSEENQKEAFNFLNA